MDESRYTICFQSRLGKDEWLRPYVSDVLKDLAEKGAKKILVFSPSFVCDCIETLHEIAIEYAEEFRSYGGEEIKLVPGLNTHLLWVEALKDLVLRHTEHKEKANSDLSLALT